MTKAGRKAPPTIGPLWMEVVPRKIMKSMEYRQPPPMAATTVARKGHNAPQCGIGKRKGSGSGEEIGCAGLPA